MTAVGEAGGDSSMVVVTTGPWALCRPDDDSEDDEDEIRPEAVLSELFIFGDASQSGVFGGGTLRMIFENNHHIEFHSISSYFVCR